jgi:FkbM family methyltransferase
LKNIFDNIYNNFSDNIDEDRFGVRDKVKNYEESINSYLSYSKERISKSRVIIDKVNIFSFLYNKLENEDSKNLLIHVLTYLILGDKKVKLPLNTKDYWNEREKIKKMLVKDDYIQTNFQGWKLFYTDLKELGYPIKLYIVALGIHNIYGVKQYEYRDNTTVIKADKGDYVIDGGACWGDSTLYFANEVGKTGRIYSFEFVPENLEVLNTNIDLNDGLKSNINIIKKALWHRSEEMLNFSYHGPGTSVDNQSEGLDVIKVESIKIDDFVETNNVPKIDFIKFDIEGSELNALKGAVRTIKKYKPKLAVSIYHKLKDFYDIPEFISSLKLNYKFYLGHSTTYSEETVLFCKVERMNLFRKAIDIILPKGSRRRKIIADVYHKIFNMK